MAGLSAALLHFSQLFSCCYIITGQETGHGETIQLINQVIDRHPSHEEDRSMCCQPRIDIHSNPCWMYLAQASNAVSFCFPPSSGGENNSMCRGILFLIAICLINLSLQWRSGAAEAIIQHLWQRCGIDQEEMNCGDSLMHARANLNPSLFYSISDEHSSIYFLKIFNVC